MTSSILIRYAETEDGSGSIRSIGDGPMFPDVSIKRTLCRSELQLEVLARFMCFKRIRVLHLVGEYYLSSVFLLPVLNCPFHLSTYRP